MKKTITLFSILFIFCLHVNATIHTVTVANFTFSPSSIPVVYLGDTVKWIWISGSHTTTSVTIPAGAASWDHDLNSGSTTFMYIPSVLGTYNYKCTPHAPMMVADFTVVACPSVSGQIVASGPTTFCQGGSVTLNCNAANGASFQWKRNGNDITVNGNGQSYIATQAGNYKVLLTNSCGNTFTTSVITVTVNPNPTVSISGDASICAGSSTTFTATPGPLNYQWSTGATTQSITLSTAGVYTVSVTNANGCTASVSRTLTVHPNPVVNITGNTSFCTGGSTTLTVSSSFTSYQWNTGETTQSITVSAAGTYEVVVTNGNGCIGSDIITVTANSLPNATIAAGGNTTFCSGGSVTLNAVVAANRAYQWKKNGVNISGATLSSYAATASGTYKVKVTNTVTGCTKTTAAGIMVTVNPVPTATVTPSGTVTFCAGQSALLTAGSGAGYMFKWKKNGNYINGATGNTYIVTTAGTYRVEVTNASGCTKLSPVVTVTVPCREGMSSGALASDGITVGELMIYPNPANEKIAVTTGYSLSASVIKIFSSDGKLVFEKNIEALHENQPVEIETAAWNNGIYLLQLISEEGMLTKRFVKE